jgi:glycosyltransferase-like protein
MRIALLTHSTNPRGGVVHALELGDALTRLGHDVAVHAPDPSGRGFGRATLCRTISVPARPAPEGLAALIRQRSDEYVRHLSGQHFDVWHAQDGISGSALLTMKQRGVIERFARTVHHVDRFDDPEVTAVQQRGLGGADTLFVVSRLWQRWLADEMGRHAVLTGNGVDTTRFSPTPDASDEMLRARLGIAPDDVVLLAIGGIEERKNTLRIVEAFANIRPTVAKARLVIAGGASLLDHNVYRHAVMARLAELELPEGAVVQTGPLRYDEMPALYRLASALVFPSLREGFGLVILEALASGIPVVTSQIEPFTEFLDPSAVSWCEPTEVGSITAAILEALRRPMSGPHVARSFGWDRVARAHLPAYEKLLEHAHA